MLETDEMAEQEQIRNSSDHIGSKGNQTQFSMVPAYRNSQLIHSFGRGGTKISIAEIKQMRDSQRLSRVVTQSMQQGVDVQEASNFNLMSFGRSIPSRSGLNTQ